MDIKLLKKEQRKEIKERWKSINKNEKKLWDEKIYDNLFSIQKLKESDVIFIYVSMENEPDTKRIIEKLLSMGKTVCVPKCEGRGFMIPYKIDSLKSLKEGAYGILEPTGEEDAFEAGDIDFGIIPCVSADKSLARLGHGGGYYDRFMERGHFTKVLLCYESLLLDKVAVESHDVSCDALITENKIYIR